MMTEQKQGLDLTDWHLPTLEAVKTSIAKVVCEVFDCLIESRDLFPHFDTIDNDPLTLVFELDKDVYDNPKFYSTEILNAQVIFKVSVRDIATKWLDIADDSDLDEYKILSRAFRQLADDIDREIADKAK